MGKSSWSEDEAHLRETCDGILEFRAADWASLNLATVIRVAAASQWAKSESSRSRAMLVLGIRLCRAVRATLAVLASGYEVEAGAMERLVFEADARLRQVAHDESNETGRLWLEGRTTTSIGAAFRANAPSLEHANTVFSGLSRRAHADIRGLLEVHGEPDVEHGSSWGPQRTIETHLVLFTCAACALGAARLIAAEADVKRPDDDAIQRYLTYIAAVLRDEIPNV